LSIHDYNLAHTFTDLDVEREKTQATMAELSRLFTDPNSEERRPEHRYNLRGVSIGPDHVEHFVLVDPTTKQEASQHEDGATDLAARSQWWRIEYLYTGLHKQPTEIENVLRAASATRDVMLVYATDDACERKEFDPADALRSFVEKDNELFSEEVAEHLPNSMQAELTYQVDEEPPAYEQALQPNDGRWVNIGEEMSMGWTPDPGLGVLSDAEYRYNTSQYADFNASSSGKGAGDEDVRMGGLAVERIEDVTDEGRLKGG
jgi:hypothetical protein